MVLGQGGMPERDGISRMPSFAITARERRFSATVNATISGARNCSKPTLSAARAASAA